MSVDPDLAETGQPYAYAGDDPVNESDPTGNMGTYSIHYDLTSLYATELSQAYIPLLNTSWHVAEGWFRKTVAVPLALRVGNGARVFEHYSWSLAPNTPTRVTDFMVGWIGSPLQSNWFEVKSGYQSLNASARRQIAFDSYYASQQANVEWDFYPNYQNVNYQTGPLINSLLGNDINVVIHRYRKESIGPIQSASPIVPQVITTAAFQVLGPPCLT